MNKILSSLVIIVAATSVARADIASVQYVDDKTLSAGENVTINNGEVSVRTAGVYDWETDGETIQDSTPVSRSSIRSILNKILPTGWDTDDESGVFCQDENGDGDYCWYGEGQSVSEYLTEIAETANRARATANAIRDDYQQKINGVAVWFDGEEVYRDEYGEGDIKTDTMVGIDEHGNVLPMGISTQGNGDFITGMHVDTLDDDEGLYQWPTLVLEKSSLPLAVSESEAAGADVEPGIVWVADDSDDEVFEKSGEYGGMVVPSFNYLQEALAGNKYTLPTANATTLGGIKVPTTSAVQVDTNGNVNVKLANSSASIDGGMDVTQIGAIKGVELGTNVAEDEATHVVSVDEGIIKIPYADTNVDGDLIPGVVNVVNNTNEFGIDNAEDDYARRFVPSVPHMTQQIADSISKIPAGSATSTTYATIWIE